MDDAKGLDGMIMFFIFFIFLIVFVYFKRKNQVGKKWNHPLSAQVSINHHPLTCDHCQGHLFYKREAILATTIIAWLFSILWNESGVAYQCKNCGRLHWFLKPKETDVRMHHDREE